jgi:peptide/nickel transport system ATP-binding protein
MCQRVLIAMAFAGNPRLVVADEPTTALDVTVQARIVRLIAELQARAGTALVFITHDLRLAADLCDEVAVLYAGRLVERAPARQLFAQPGHPYTKCLQLANPGMSGERRALFVLPDQMPGLQALATLQGCRFAGRCPLGQPEPCAVREPPLEEVQSDHVAACFYTDRIATVKAPPLAFSRPVSLGASAATPVLDVQDVSKEFLVSHGLLGRNRVAAVRHVDFCIGAGEFVGLVGESGSGKSTLAKLVIGLEQSSAGRILFDRKDRQSGLTRRQRIETVQMVFQDPQSALNPRSRVGAIVTQAMEVGSSRGTRQDRVARAAELLAEVGMAPEMSSRFPSQLSGGQRQRVNIARALCVLPKLLVADEIVSGLDVSVQAQLLNLLLRLRAELGFAMLFISHDLSVVRYLCDRVLVMYRGEIVEQGATDNVFTAPQHDYTRTLLAAVPPDDPTQYRPIIGDAIGEIQIAAK